MTVNQRIFHYRRLAGLTQAEVAEKMGLKLPTYSKMEREGRITIDKLEKIAKILEMDMEELITGKKKELPLYIPVPIPPKPDGEVIVKQPEPPIKVTEYIPTAREKAAMKAVHNLPKNVQEEIYDFITKKMNENSKAKK